MRKECKSTIEYEYKLVAHHTHGCEYANLSFTLSSCE